MHATYQEGEKECSGQHAKFLGGGPWTHPPPPQNTPSSAPIQMERVPSCSSLNYLFICILTAAMERGAAEL
eukprot:641910-Pelagomonas_calceolata.AAC.4